MTYKWRINTDMDATLYRKGIHGVEHARRVLLLVQAQRLNESPNM
jgi:hypothetical protein